MAELIAEQVRASDDVEKAHIFFSAHGVPKSYVEEAGDPYQQEIQACAALIMAELETIVGHPNPHTLAYQSRVGPVEWLKPYTEEALLCVESPNSKRESCKVFCASVGWMPRAM